MKIIDYREAEAHVVESGEMKGVIGRVVIGKSDGAGNFCMRVFELPKGAVSHHHTHAWEHEVFVYAGRGEVLREGEWVPVQPGAVVFIPGNEEHQLRNVEDEPFVFVCLVPSSAPEM
jgi:quercetin dioxygenase-like cupin family protein